MNEELLSLLKALADENRLKILGLLAQSERSVEELAALLNVRPPTASHHLSTLARVGLVHARAQGYYNFYRLDPTPLQSMLELLIAPDTLTDLASGVDPFAYQEELLARFRGVRGRFKAIPRPDQRHGQAFALLLKDLERDTSYSEIELEAVLERMTEDPVDLRQKLIQKGWLVRKGKRYRRPRAS